MRKHIYYSLALMAVTWAASSYANDGLTPQSSLDYTLATLKESVAKLSSDNKSLDSENVNGRAQIASFRQELRSLVEEESSLLAQFSGLQGQFEKKLAMVNLESDKLAVLNNDIAALEQDFTQLLMELKTVEEAADEFSRQSAALVMEIERLRKDVALSLPKVRVEGSEIQNLNRDIQAASRTLEERRETWITLNSVIEAGPGERGRIEGELLRLNEALAGRNQESVQFNGQLAEEKKALEELKSSGGSRGLPEFETEVRRLRLCLEDLKRKAADQAKKVASRKKESGQISLEERLQKALDINRDHKAELAKLQKDMIEFDKRKSTLEKKIYGSAN